MPIAITGYGRIQYETIEELQEKLKKLKAERDKEYMEKFGLKVEPEPKVEQVDEPKEDETSQADSISEEDTAKEEVKVEVGENTESVGSEEEETPITSTEEDSGNENSEDSETEGNDGEEVEPKAEEVFPLPDPSDRKAWVELAEELGIKTYRVKTPLIIEKVKEALTKKGVKI